MATVSELTAQAQQLYNAKDWANLVGVMQQLVDLQPDVHMHYYNLAVAQFQLQEYGRCEQTLKACLRLDPENRNARALLVRVEEINTTPYEQFSAESAPPPTPSPAPAPPPQQSFAVPDGPPAAQPAAPEPTAVQPQAAPSPQVAPAPQAAAAVPQAAPQPGAAGTTPRASTAPRPAPATPIQSAPTELVTTASFRTATPVVTHTALMIGALLIGRYLIALLPGMETRLGSLDIYGWLSIAVSIAVLVLMIRVYTPLHIVVLYYFSNKLGVTVRTGEQYQQLQSLCKYAQAFLFLVVLYPTLFPTLRTLIYLLAQNSYSARTHEAIKGLLNVITVLAVGAGLFFLYSIWSIMRPQLQKLNERISNTIVAAGTAKFTCPKCQTVNEPGTRFCNNCGETLQQPKPSAVICPQCNAANQPETKFCGNCGAALAPSNQPQQV